MSCLDYNVIPRGLIIKKAPQTVGKGIYKRNVISNWERTLRRASQLLLKHLKNYHKGVVTSIKTQIKEQAKLRRQIDCGQTISYIYHLAHERF